MAWTKAKMAIVTGVVFLVVAGTATVAVVAVKNTRANEIENYFSNWQSMNLDTATLPTVTLLRPSKYANKGDYILGSHNPGPDSRVMRRGATLPEIIGTAYDFSPEEMVLPPNLPKGQYDMLLTGTSHSREDLQAELKRQFGITAHPETRDQNVLVMKVVNADAPGLKVSSVGGPNVQIQRGTVKMLGFAIDDAAHFLGRFFNAPIDNETGLTEKYDIDLHWSAAARGDAQRKELTDAIRDQLGLELTPDKQSVKMLVVERKS